MSYKNGVLIITEQGTKARVVKKYSVEIQELYEEMGYTVHLAKSEKEFVLEYKYCEKDKIYKPR